SIRRPRRIELHVGVVGELDRLLGARATERQQPEVAERGERDVRAIRRDRRVDDAHRALGAAWLQVAMMARVSGAFHAQRGAERNDYRRSEWAVTPFDVPVCRVE